MANLSLAPEKPVFNSGDFVRVRPYRMITRGLNGAVLISECRVIGVRGVVERVCSERKTRQSSLLVWMYRRFDFIEDIWPEQHDGKNEDGIKAEVYEPWLEALAESSGNDLRTLATYFLIIHITHPTAQMMMTFFQPCSLSQP